MRLDRIPIGVMQGRLLPKFEGRYQAHPVTTWMDEFAVANKFGLQSIEFILDFEGALLNPLLRIDGYEEIVRCIAATGVKVASICADYFMDRPFHLGSEEDINESRRILNCLLNVAPKIGVQDVVIPCVERSQLKGLSDMRKFVDNISVCVSEAERQGVNISLETDLSPDNFARLLELADSKRVTVNYDIGNSASMDYDPIDEFAAYGNRISDVHIKDRLRNGRSVFLGKGSARFDRFFEALSSQDYDGYFIMQAYRDDEGLEVFRAQLDWFRNAVLNESRVRNI